MSESLIRQEDKNKVVASYLVACGKECLILKALETVALCSLRALESELGWSPEISRLHRSLFIISTSTLEILNILLGTISSLAVT